MKPTYTREQLEALRDNGHDDTKWTVKTNKEWGEIAVLGESPVKYGELYIAEIKQDESGEADAELIAAAPALLSDLLSALDEIERLRTALEHSLSEMDTIDEICVLAGVHRLTMMREEIANVLKETNNER